VFALRQYFMHPVTVFCPIFGDDFQQARVCRHPVAITGFEGYFIFQEERLKSRVETFE
jgi:hypothetical protein